MGDSRQGNGRMVDQNTLPHQSRGRITHHTLAPNSLRSISSNVRLNNLVSNRLSTESFILGLGATWQQQEGANYGRFCQQKILQGGPPPL